MTLSAFYAQAQVRQLALQNFSAQLQAEKIYAGSLYYEPQKCSVAGSLILSNDAQTWKDVLGLPLWFAYALDAVTNPIRPQFLAHEVETLLNAIPLGIDLSDYAPKVIVAFLQQIDAAMLIDSPLAEVLTRVNDVYQQQLQNNPPTAASWRQLRKNILSAKDRLAALPEPHAARNLPLERQHAIGNVLEACAWNSLSSATTVAEVIQYWIFLQNIELDLVFGWGAEDQQNIEAALEQMYSQYIVPNNDEQRDVYQLLEQYKPELAARLRDYYQFTKEFDTRNAQKAASILFAVLNTAA